MQSRSHLFAVVFAVALAGCRDGDGTIKRRVEERLAADPEGAGLTVSVEDRVVRLVGVVDSQAEKTRLENAARGVYGVLAVRNELVIAEPVTTTGATSDAHRALEASIEAQLSAAGHAGLRIAVTDGTVRIAGRVPSERHDEVIGIARQAAPGFRIADETSAR